MKKLAAMLIALCLGCSSGEVFDLSQFAPELEAFGDELCAIPLSNFEACVSECVACGCLADCVDDYVYEQAVTCSTSADCEMTALNDFWTCTDRAVNTCEMCEAELETQLESCQG